MFERHSEQGCSPKADVRVIFDRDEAVSRCRHVGYSPKAEVKSGYWHLLQWGFAG
jgi:hypothetical protein